ncbi:MAG: hypothetical protein OHK0017_11610 [Patescibacteria group bacterium]
MSNQEGVNGSERNEGGYTADQVDHPLAKDPQGNPNPQDHPHDWSYLDNVPGPTES